METKKIRTRYNYQLQESDLTPVDSKSETIPGDAYTIKELYAKFTTGIMPPIGKMPSYDPDPDIDNPDPTRTPGYDLADATATLDTLAAQIEEANNAKEERKRKKKASAEKSEANEEANEEKTTD